MTNNVCEEKVFSSIYNNYSKDLHNYLYYRYGDQFDPSDKVQEAFVNYGTIVKMSNLIRQKVLYLW